MRNREASMKVLGLIFLSAALSASAATQSLELIAGYPELGDIRYGIEWKPLGIAFTSGLPLLIGSRFRDKEDQNVIPYSWNPSVAVFKRFRLSEHLWVRPALEAEYWYGWGGELAVAGCGECSTDFKLRTDQLSIKEGLGLAAVYKKWFFEANPGVLQLRRIPVVVSSHGPVPSFKSIWEYPGPVFSASIGREF